MRQNLLDRLAAERRRDCHATSESLSRNRLRPAMRITLRRPDGHVGGSRDLLEREPERVLQNDHTSLFGRDLCQAAVQLAAQLGPVGLASRIRVGGCSSILEQRLAGSSPLPVPHVSAGVDRQPVQPGRKL